MKTVIFLGKRKSREDPLTRYPGAQLWGTTHSNQKYAKRYGTIDSWHAWFDVHPFDRSISYEGIKRKRPATYKWYQSLPGPDKPNYRPLFLAELDQTIPAGVLFPTERVLDAFKIPGEGYGWHTCMVDLLMGKAILDGFEHIVLHGHGVSREQQHMIDHVGVIYWIAIARERGIKVTVQPPSWYIAPKHPYGVSTSGPWGLRP